MGNSRARGAVPGDVIRFRCVPEELFGVDKEAGMFSGVGVGNAVFMIIRWSHPSCLICAVER